MPRYNPEDLHCVNCAKFSEVPGRQCEIRLKVENMYGNLDPEFQTELGVDIYYHLYSFVCRCDLFERKSQLTAEFVLQKILDRVELTEEEQQMADRLLNNA